MKMHINPRIYAAFKYHRIQQSEVDIFCAWNIFILIQLVMKIWMELFYQIGYSSHLSQ